MGRTICTAGFPSAAIASSCFTARCDSIWYGFIIATPFSRQKKLLLAYQDFERGVATFYDLPGIPIVAGEAMKFGWPRLNSEYAQQFGIEVPSWPPKVAQS